MTEDRNAAARAALTPYEPGERPWPIVVSSLAAFALGALTLTLHLARVKVSGQQPALSVVIVYTGLMFACAAGTWRMRYWAVLGFQTLLAIGILGFALALIRVTSVEWLLICLAVMFFAGLLFWKLVRVLGRMQMPARPEP
jgi:succinate-acetate transporter protein